jgi:hypothetical protein
LRFLDEEGGAHDDDGAVERSNRDIEQSLAVAVQ